ncbi:ERMES complex subunit mmm1 [Tulasnella sp. 417]|nr:ERMES complex subunit mmm1 [Tulasnella sp. 417]
MPTIFSLTPTFTQGLVIGQVSIFLLLALILRYLFLEPAVSSRPPSLPALAAAARQQHETSRSTSKDDALEADDPPPAETAEWFNVILQNIAQAYRQQIRNTLEGPSGDEAARRRVEGWLNDRRSASLLDVIKVHAIDVGTGAPKLVRARILAPDKHCATSRIECHLAYSDDVSLSLSTSLLLHYPTPSFARLPVSLTVSSIDFAAKVTVTPPLPSDPSPCLTLTLDPSFTLDIKTNSLLGSRAKLSDVPKVHELIAQRIRTSLASRGTWKILLPGVRAKDVVDMLEKKQ